LEIKAAGLRADNLTARSLNLLSGPDKAWTGIALKKVAKHFESVQAGLAPNHDGTGPSVYHYSYIFSLSLNFFSMFVSTSSLSLHRSVFSLRILPWKPMEPSPAFPIHSTANLTQDRSSIIFWKRENIFETPYFSFSSRRMMKLLTRLSVLIGSAVKDS
jgi:hypothetical protein